MLLSIIYWLKSAPIPFVCVPKPFYMSCVKMDLLVKSFIMVSRKLEFLPEYSQMHFGVLYIQT